MRNRSSRDIFVIDEIILSCYYTPMREPDNPLITFGYANSDDFCERVDKTGTLS